MVTIRRLQAVESEDESAWESLDLNNNNNNNADAREQSRQHQPKQQQQEQTQNNDSVNDPSAPPSSLEDRIPSHVRFSPSVVEIISSPPSSPATNKSQGNNSSSSSSATNTGAAADPIMLDAASSAVLLKESLVHHPMNLFWSRFLLHFTQELWKLDVHIRLALALIALGAVVKLLLWMTWFVWNPRTFSTILLGLGPFLYLQRHTIQRRLQQLAVACGSTTASSPDALLEAALGRLEPAQLRRFMFFILLVPTLLEARTIVFLSSIKLDQADSWSTMYNVTIATVLAVGAYYFGFSQPQNSPPRRFEPRECLQRALLFLYASALCVSLICLDLWRLPHLIAPFCLASGVLILAWHDDDGDNVDGTSSNNGWFSNCIRQALRLTVRDILTSITDSVCQDEMLQLAMLRWIVEYWSTSTNTSTTSNARSSSSSSTPPAAPSSTATTRSTTTSSSAAPVRNSTHNDEGLRNTATFEQQHQQLQWDELWPMLDTTTNQMAVEVHSLHGAGANTNTASATSNANTDHSASNNSATPDPVRELQSLLASLDLDERAKPAVMAYKRGVQDFPPERNWSIAFAIIHRCPAILALVWQVHYYWTLEWRRALLLLLPWSVTWSAMLILLPLVALELLRIHTWICSCQAAAAAASNIDTKEEEDYAACLQVLDPMTILLSGDDYNPRRPPTLLRVWRNVTDSVEALEVGIVTTRCLQTTAVAAEFADNVRSLLQFGAEVQEYGWVHGIAVALKEVILYHQQENHNAAAATSSRTTTSVATVHRPAKYANAAVGAFRNSRQLSRNLKILAQDEDVTKLKAPLLSALSMITAYGWLWGRSDEGQQIEKEDSSKTTSETAGDVISGAEKRLEEQLGSSDKELVQPVKETEIASDLPTSTDVALTTTAAVSAAMAKKYNIRIPNDDTNQTANHVTSDQSPAGDDEIVLLPLSSSSPVAAEPTSLGKNVDDSPAVSSNSVKEKKNSDALVAANACIADRTNDNNIKTENDVPSNHNPAREVTALSTPPSPSNTDEARAPHDKSNANDAAAAELNVNKDKVEEESRTVWPNSVEDVKKSAASVEPFKSAERGAALVDTGKNDSPIKAADLRIGTAKEMELIAVCDEHGNLHKDEKNAICEKLVSENPNKDSLQGLLENNNAPTSALVVSDRSRQPDNPQLDFTGSLRQILLVEQGDGGTVPNGFLPKVESDDEWEGLDPDPFESDPHDQPTSKKQQQKEDVDDGDQHGGNNLFLGLAAVGAAAIGVAAVAFSGQNNKNNDKNDNQQQQQKAQRSRSNATS